MAHDISIPAVTLDLGSAQDMFVGPTDPRWRATSAARRTFVGLDLCGGPHK